MIKILVDCYGGDKSPNAQIDGALSALCENKELSLILVGKESEISAYLSDKKYDKERLSIVNADSVITCHDKPTDAIRLNRESSMMVAIKLLRETDDIKALVSCGSTGALVAASMLRIGRLKGIIRPAFCPVIPTMSGSLVGISDTGANVDITPTHLLQYAIMGSVYMKDVWNISNPRVALLNIGEEAEKGDELRKQAYSLLSSCDSINFVGNAEARDVLSGKYDLIICDGFSGNVLIKSIEGTSLGLLKKLKADIMAKLRYKMGALLLKDMLLREKRFMNYQNYGGSVLIGTLKTVVKGHGSSNATAVAKCIEQAYKMEFNNIGGQIETLLEKENQNV